MEEEEKRKERNSEEEKNESVKGEREGGEEVHSERSCFYSLSFLAEAKDMLSSDGVCLLGQTASYSILLYCIVFCYIWISAKNNYIITVSVRQSGKHNNIMLKEPKMRVRAHTRTHAFNRT